MSDDRGRQGDDGADIREDGGHWSGEAPTAPSTVPVATSTAANGDSFRRREHRGIVVPVVVAAIVAALLGGSVGAGIALAVDPRHATTTSSSSGGAGSGVVINNPTTATAVSAIAQKASPSVVTISVSAPDESGTGSGIVLSKDGYVLTNNHVVTLDGDTSGGTITVTTTDGHLYKARIVGTDPLNDLAVIKLADATDLTPAAFGDSADLNVGDPVVAIGAPLDLPNTVTTGIVSALNRSISVASSAVPDAGSDSGGQGGGSPFNFWDFGDDGQQQPQQQSRQTSSIYLSVLQTDAAINPGNSGGALLDGAGRVIGVNVAIAGTGSSASGSQSGSIGVGFAIPSVVAKRIADDLIAGRPVTHGRLGVSSPSNGSSTTGSVAGVEVSSAQDGQAAAKAGIRKGDVITAVDGVAVTDYTSLAGQVLAHEGGAKVPVTYVRNGRSETVTVTLGSVKA